MSYVLSTMRQTLKDVVLSLGPCHIQDPTVWLKWSDRPDLSDFQSNIALPLVKLWKKAPRQIAEEIVKQLPQDGWYARVDGPGFINISVKDDWLLSETQRFLEHPSHGVPRPDRPQHIFLDFGGPNIAKPLHVGHLRSLILGESLRRLALSLGHRVTTDVHWGDWGLPMGLILAGLERDPQYQYAFESLEGARRFHITFENLVEIYPAASKRKEDPEFLERARELTKRLQERDPILTTIWSFFRNISIAKIVEVFELLGAHFDESLGESDCHDQIKPLLEDLKRKGWLEESEGAWVVNFEKKGLDLPVMLLEKSDGAVLYTSTDLATLVQRVERYQPDAIWYVVDSRQSLHFQQLFTLVQNAGIVSSVKLEHIGFGTINGPDGKPLKTREGKQISLDQLIEGAVQQIKERLAQREEPLKHPQEVARKVALSAIKFADLMNFRESNYQFDEKKFGFEGKTGPYCLYTIARIRSLLRKASQPNGSIEHLLPPSHPAERALYLYFHKLPETLESAFQNRTPHVLCDWIFNLSQLYNQFYLVCPILKEKRDDKRRSLLSLSYFVQEKLEYVCSLLGLDSVDEM